MFTIAASPTFQPTVYAVAPSSSPFATSPLAPRDPNARRQARPFDTFNTFKESFSMASSTTNVENMSAPRTQQHAPLDITRRESASRHRGSKFSALLQRKDAGAERERRKDAYLRGVKSRRDDARWEERGEMSLRRDYFDEQREWAAQQAKAAEMWMASPEEVDEIESANQSMEDFDDSYDLPQMPEESEVYDYDVFDMDQPIPSSDFGSDGEYERLLLEAAAEAEAQAQMSQQHEVSSSFAADERDVAMG